nr:serine hydrolase [Pseudoalteromonas luteoviolacea]
MHRANKNGALLLDEPITYWLPFALSHSSAHLTLTQLLTHQSGMIDNPNMLTYAPSANLAHYIGFHDSPDILLASYLNEDGALYHAVSEDTPIYSRQGVTLARYAFTQAT